MRFEIGDVVVRCDWERFSAPYAVRLVGTVERPENNWSDWKGPAISVYWRGTKTNYASIGGIPVRFVEKATYEI